ncbi:NAD-P-binding protein [Artomyces pyxidatus]|uniref:NAD-P-binding protein n=1 Tax=Artomyces pyxidatus TaxID=48021 RepID=A0ACB8SVX3_9AGAM|nr:NAD-P-binding protein [Artomyces pyxidatus]
MGLFHSKPSYDPARDIPDLTGKVVVVTGSNAGIGYHTADQLARRGGKVYLACRTESKAREAIASIERASPSLKGEDRLVWLPLDLSSIRSTKAAAEEVITKEKRLDILANNAGRLTDRYELNADGVELSVAVNHIGPYVFTTTLLPLLKRTAEEPGPDVRIVNVSSSTYNRVGQQTKFGSLEDFNESQSKPGNENTYRSKFKRYGKTKIMNILTRELQRRLDEEGVPITVIALHPGGVAIDGAHEKSPWYFAATSAEVAAARDKYKGQFLVPYGQLHTLQTNEAQDPVLAQTLWKATEKVVDGAAGR